MGKLKLFLFFFLLYSCCFAQNAPIENLRVGAILPFSGELAYFGKAFQRGASLAVDDGLAKYLTIHYEDDKSADRKTAVNALHSLLGKHKIQLVILTGMPSAVVVDSIVEKNNIIAFSAWDSNKQLDKLSSNTYGFGWSNEKTGEDLAEHAINNLGLKKFAIVQAQDEWSLLISDSFEKKIKSKGGKVIFRDTVNLDDTDFLSLVTKIKKAMPQAVYFPLYRASVLAFAKQIIQMKYPGVLLTAEGMTESELKQIGTSANGMYVTQAKIVNSKFQKKYFNKFGNSDNLNLAHVAIGYDVIYYLNSCVELLRSKKLPITSENLKTIFIKNKFRGILGISNFSDKRIIERGQAILVVQNRKLVPIN